MATIIDNNTGLCHIRGILWLFADVGISRASAIVMSAPPHFSTCRAPPGSHHEIATSIRHDSPSFAGRVRCGAGFATGSLCVQNNSAETRASRYHPCDRRRMRAVKCSVTPDRSSVCGVMAAQERLYAVAPVTL